MAALRTPGTGCPWDLEQNFRTIAPYTLEEAYEVADAIARDDLAGLKDELGDLLLQVVFHARMAQEQDAFGFGDVVEALTAKLIRRHPHVFADADGKTADAVKGLWERIKAEERAERGEKGAGGALAGVPVTHRAVTHEFVVVSGHVAPGHPESLVNWNALAAMSGTIVLLMAVERIELFAKVLLEGGRPADTPVLVVQHGTTAAQQTLRATLQEVAEKIRAEGIRPPAIIVIGDVAAFAGLKKS